MSSVVASETAMVAVENILPVGQDALAGPFEPVQVPEEDNQEADVTPELANSSKKRKKKFDPASETDVKNCESALSKGMSLGKFRHAVLVQVFISKIKLSQQEAEAKKKDDLIQELTHFATASLVSKAVCTIDNILSSCYNR